MVPNLLFDDIFNSHSFGQSSENFLYLVGGDTADSVVIYDYLLQNTDPKKVVMELDLYWIYAGGGDALEYFNKYPGRFQLLHFKDMKTNQPPFFEVIKDDVCSVGEGVIDFKKIWAAKDVAGAKYLFVEDDNQGNGKPFEGIDTSIKNITTKILV